MGILSRCLHIIDMISEWTGRTFAVFLPILGLVVFYEVVSRYVFDNPTSWAHDISSFLLIAMSMGGFAYTLRHKGHVNMEVLYLILGWLLGLLSPSIANRISRSYSKKELLNGIKTEMKECQFRALLVANMLGSRYGKFDKEYLNWCLPYLENYQGAENIENTLKTVTSFLESKDEDLEKRFNDILNEDD